MEGRSSVSLAVYHQSHPSQSEIPMAASSSFAAPVVLDRPPPSYASLVPISAASAPSQLPIRPRWKVFTVAVFIPVFLLLLVGYISGRFLYGGKTDLRGLDLGIFFVCDQTDGGDPANNNDNCQILVADMWNCAQGNNAAVVYFQADGTLNTNACVQHFVAEGLAFLAFAFSGITLLSVYWSHRRNTALFAALSWSCSLSAIVLFFTIPVVTFNNNSGQLESSNWMKIQEDGKVSLGYAFALTVAGTAIGFIGATALTFQNRFFKSPEFS